MSIPILKKPSKYKKQYTNDYKKSSQEKKLLISVAKPIANYAIYKLIGLFK